MKPTCKDDMRFWTGFGRAVTVTSLTVFLCLAGPVSDVAGQAAKGKVPRRTKAPVVVEQVVRKVVRPNTTLIGTAEPAMKSTVASEIESLVVGFPVRKGQRVRKGDVLARIEKTTLILDLRQARALLAETEENYKDAQSELRRSEKLFKQKTISSRKYDEDVHKAAALKQKILALEAKIEAIEHDIKRCTIRAPFSGFVVEEHTQIGQWLKKGSAVVTLANLDPILVTVPVPDRYINAVEAGQVLELEFDFLPENRRRKGSVRHIIPQGNERARTFPVQISLPNKDVSILPGMSCKVSLSVGRAYEASLVSKDAVVTSGDEHHVFAVRDGKAVMVSVEKGQADGSKVVVEGKLRAGESVVVEGNERLRPGQAVKIIMQR